MVSSKRKKDEQGGATRVHSSLSLSPPTILSGGGQLQSPSIAVSSCTSAGGVVEAGVNCTDVYADSSWSNLQKLSVDLEGLIVSQQEEDSYSDAELVLAGGTSVPVHRCILSVRSSFFRRAFKEASKEASTEASPEAKMKIDKAEVKKEPQGGKVKIDLTQFVDGAARITKQALTIVLGYLYSGKLRSMEECSGIACMDSQCPHFACWPVVEFCLELMYSGWVFQIPELKNMAQEHLHKLVPRAQPESVLQILMVAGKHQDFESLQEVCLPVLVKSNLPATAFSKSTLCRETVVKIATMRQRLGLHVIEQLEDKLCQRVYKALDSDDLELMDMLLKEANATVDSVYALHYAASYCDVKTFRELVELSQGDINNRDRYRYTVLHAATLRRNPEVLGIVVSKGADPFAKTPEGFTALEVCKRIARNIDMLNSPSDAHEDWLRDKICVEILEQAERVNPCPVFPDVDDHDLYYRLLYLENRVALAKMLWPREAKVVYDLSQLDSTKEYTHAAAEGCNLMDLNKEPSRCMDDKLRKRVQALQKAIEVGHRFFPRCTAILNKFMDDGSFEHECIKNRRIPEDQLKRIPKDQRDEAYLRDVEDQNLQMCTRS